MSPITCELHHKSLLTCSLSQVRVLEGELRSEKVFDNMLRHALDSLHEQELSALLESKLRETQSRNAECALQLAEQTSIANQVHTLKAKEAVEERRLLHTTLAAFNTPVLCQCCSTKHQVQDDECLTRVDIELHHRKQGRHRHQLHMLSWLVHQVLKSITTTITT